MIKKFAIYSNPRSSTGWICNKLDSLPTVRCRHEIFHSANPNRILDEQKIYDQCLSLQDSNKINFFGFKVFPWQFYNKNPEDFFAHNNIHVFVYLRINFIGCFLSLCYGFADRGNIPPRNLFDILFFDLYLNYERLYAIAKTNNYDLIHPEDKKSLEKFSEYFYTEIDFADVKPYQQNYKKYFNEEQIIKIKPWLQENTSRILSMNHSLPKDIVENIKQGIV